MTLDYKHDIKYKLIQEQIIDENYNIEYIKKDYDLLRKISDYLAEYLDKNNQPISDYDIYYKSIKELIICKNNLDVKLLKIKKNKVYKKVNNMLKNIIDILSIKNKKRRV